MLGRLFMILGLVGALSLASPAFAAEPDESTVAQYQAELDEYKQAKAADAAKKDIDMVQKWLDEAQVLLANGDEGAAKRRLKRVEFGLDLVRAIVAAEQVRMAAEDQESAAYSAPETTAKLKSDIEDLLNQKQQLQNELKKLKQ